MKENKNKPPALFISKLYNILKEKKHSKTIYWDSQLGGIRIINQRRMQETILPNYFRHHRFSSFVRQLNMYDFHKIYLPDHKSIFIHAQFDPKKKQSLRNVRRKIVSQSANQNNLIDKQQDNIQIIQKTSIRNLIKNSFFNIRSGKFGTQIGLNDGDVLQQILIELKQITKDKNILKKKLRQLKKLKKYRRFIRNNQFRMKIYARLGIQPQIDDKLSQLSIQQQLLINTKKSLTIKSLKLLESGPLFFKDSIGMLLN